MQRTWYNDRRTNKQHQGGADANPQQSTIWNQFDGKTAIEKPLQLILPHLATPEYSTNLGQRKQK